jgi:hypothetical protein
MGSTDPTNTYVIGVEPMSNASKAHYQGIRGTGMAKNRMPMMPHEHQELSPQAACLNLATSSETTICPDLVPSSALTPGSTTGDLRANLNGQLIS